MNIILILLLAGVALVAYLAYLGHLISNDGRGSRAASALPRSHRPDPFSAPRHLL